MQSDAGFEINLSAAPESCIIPTVAIFLLKTRSIAIALCRARFEQLEPGVLTFKTAHSPGLGLLLADDRNLPSWIIEG
ncbi:hypothetical protein [Sphingopyxis terrae]|uniref:hypothetical protein n=1 Tax=Sphingopyxis terrae TaxID=33052 RepID=UPI000786E9C1|nr:hypothetical protein [Sphingopyxis terrae]